MISEAKLRELAELVGMPAEVVLSLLPEDEDEQIKICSEPVLPRKAGFGEKLKDAMQPSAASCV